MSRRKIIEELRAEIARNRAEMVRELAVNPTANQDAWIAEVDSLERACEDQERLE